MNALQIAGIMAFAVGVASGALSATVESRDGRVLLMLVAMCAASVAGYCVGFSEAFRTLAAATWRP